MNKVWINGNIVDSENSISSSDRGFTLGDGAFETMYFDSGQIEYFEMHIIRLKSTLSKIYINLPYNEKQILSAVGVIAEENKLTCGAVRLTVSRGCGKRGIAFDKDITPTVVISIASVERMQPPVKVCLTDYSRNEKSPLSSFKMLNYSNAVMAMHIAKTKGFGDAVMLNTAGNVVSATTSNIFLLRGDVLITPDLTDGCLPGIMRSAILNAGKKLGLKIGEASVTIEHLKTADAVFLTNSIVRIRKVAGFEDTEYNLENEIIAKIESELR